MMDKITVASVNCRGLGNVQKRRDVFHYLRQKRYSIYFLQDKIWTRNSTNTSQRIGVLVRILVPIKQDLRCVAILFNNNFKFKVKGIFRDNGGKGMFCW